jgi:hypothetical protein
MAAAVERGRQILVSAAPPEARQHLNAAPLIFQQIEFARDIEMPGAETIAHLLLRSSLANSYYVDEDVYPSGVGGSRDRGAAVCRAYIKKKGAAVKTYAKRGDLLRIEVTYGEREAVNAAMGARTEEFSGDGALRLAEAIAAESLPLLDGYEEHVIAVASSTATPSTMAIALRPLIEFASQDKALGRGRPPSAKARADALAAYDQLILSGRFFGKNMDKDHPVRRVLDRLVEGSVLLHEPGRYIAYALSPALAAGVTLPAHLGSSPGIPQAHQRPER